MSQDSRIGKRSESTVNSFGSGNGHSRTIPATVPSILSTVIMDEPESSSERRYGPRTPRRTDPPLGSNSREVTSQRKPTAIDFAQLQDGSLAETVENPENSRQTLLAVWRDGIVSYHRRLNGDDGHLIPLPRTGEIMQHVRLPRGVKPYSSTASLVYGLVKLIQRCVSITEDNLLPLASFILASWVVDRLPMAPYLSITGLPQSGKTTLLKVLSLVCRRGLLLAHTAPESVYQAYDRLMPTLLIDDCDPTERSRELRQLLRMSTTRGVATMRNGKLLRAYGMKAIAWNEPPHDLALSTRCVQIEMVESSHDLARVDDENTKEQASELRAQLLQFRFEHYRQVRIHKLPDADRLRVSSRDLLRRLAAPCADEPELCERLARFFKVRDIMKREPLPRPESVVLAALFSEIHQRSYAGLVAIKNLTNSVNKILKGNDEYLRLNPRKVGAILTSFGISHRKRTSYGYEILLEDVDQVRVHKFASAHGIDDHLDHSVRIIQRECHLCGGRPLKKETETAEILDDAH